ncbi:hypothetical protein LSAT2_018832 [Lamellibrachia satsuma]|nr:hypothetical protein LSAT2_018832 [Lamellibrachia satsuma]
MYLLKRYFKTRISAVMSGSENKESAEQSLKAWEANVDLTKLNEKQKRIHAEHLKAIKEGRSWYLDPETGYEVFTILSHLTRGRCCGNACRHCPYQHTEVCDNSKITTTFNSAFYD